MLLAPAGSHQDAAQQKDGIDKKHQHCLGDTDVEADGHQVAAHTLHNASLLIFSALNVEAFCRPFSSTQEFRVGLVLKL